MPHLVLKRLRVLGMSFANVRSQKTIVSVLDAGPRGRVSLTQGEASTFTMPREVFGHLGFVFGCENRLADTRSAVVAVSADFEKVVKKFRKF